jgi:fermentation-respiration switch protein FrsA (DUF1100 family)
MTADWPGLLSMALRIGRGTLLGLAIGWLCALALLWIFQRNFLYMAPRMPPGAPPAGYVTAALATSDGLQLTAWYRPAAAKRPTIVFFSAQGASLPASADWAEGFAQAGLGLMLVSFRGFDGNPGSPSEEGLYRDGRAALAWLAAHGVQSPVIVGLSLGTGVAAEMAVEAATPPADWPAACKPRGLILLSPYESIPDIAALRYPFFPTRPLVRDRFDTQAKIGALRMPVLVVHGALDDLIPLAQGLAVYSRAPQPKTFVALAEAGHNYPSAAILQPVEHFLAGLAD